MMVCNGNSKHLFLKFLYQLLRLIKNNLITKGSNFKNDVNYEWFLRQLLIPLNIIITLAK